MENKMYWLIKEKCVLDDIYKLSRQIKITMLLIVLSLLSNVSLAEFFNFSGYSINEKISDITKYSPSIFGIYIDYSLVGEIKKSFENYCIIQRDTSVYQPIECKKTKIGNYLTDYMRMYIIIDTNQNLSCILNVSYYDNKDNLLQLRPLATLDTCAWGTILPVSSIDEARKYINKVKSRF